LLRKKNFSKLFLIHSFLCSILFPIFNMGIGYFLHTERVCSAEGQMFLATYAGMSTKKKLSDTQQAVSPKKGDFMPLHTEWKQDYRPPHSATVFFSSLLPRPSTVIAGMRRQRGGGAQCNGGRSLRAARRRRQRGGGNSAAAAAWRRSGGGSRAVAAHSATVGAAWRWHGSGGSLAAAA